MTKYALVGDVGGTNARLALCDVSSGEISRAKTYSQGWIIQALRPLSASIWTSIRLASKTAASPLPVR